jgi:hypothetical protein
MMPHILTRSLDRAATTFILIVAGLGILIPLSNLLLPEGSFFQCRPIWWRCGANMPATPFSRSRSI